MTSQMHELLVMEDNATVSQVTIPPLKKRVPPAANPVRTA